MVRGTMIRLHNITVWIRWLNTAHFAEPESVDLGLARSLVSTPTGTNRNVARPASDLVSGHSARWRYVLFGSMWAHPWPQRCVQNQEHVGRQKRFEVFACNPTWWCRVVLKEFDPKSPFSCYLQKPCHHQRNRTNYRQKAPQLPCHYSQMTE